MENKEIKVHAALVSLGSTIKSIRRARKLSRAEFGSLVGIAEKTVHNIEKGHGFTMETFLLVILYARLEKQLTRWLKENTKHIQELV